MGSKEKIKMGNAQARQRIKARDFDYLAKFTGFANEELVEEYFDTLMDKYPDGKMSIKDFIDTFKIAFPERPEDKIQKLATNMTEFPWPICSFCSTCFVAETSRRTWLEFSIF